MRPLTFTTLLLIFTFSGTAQEVRIEDSGTEYFRFHEGRIHVLNTGGSVYLGEDAGVSDNLLNSNNTFLGYWSGYNTQGGFRNAGIGYGSLLLNTTGSNNNAIGFFALGGNTTGNYNTALGYHALFDNTTGHSNIAVGPGALKEQGEESFSVAVGDSSLYSNTTGTGNTAIGSKTLTSNTVGNRNTALGYRALFSNIGASNNTALGHSAMYNTTSGANNNIAIGFQALHDNTTGHSNSALGTGALESATIANHNVGVGRDVMSSTTTGSDNVAVGSYALHSNVGGSQNVAIGKEAGFSTTGSGNVYIGYQAGLNSGSSNQLYIANSSTTNPLIFGSFATSFLRINGRSEVRGNSNVVIPLLALIETDDDAARLVFKNTTHPTEAWSINALTNSDPTSAQLTIDYLNTGTILTLDPDGDVTSGNDLIATDDLYVMDDAHIAGILDMQFSRIHGVAAPLVDADAVNLGYLEDYVESYVEPFVENFVNDLSFLFPTEVSEESIEVMNFAQCATYCRNLVEGGHDDWGIPSAEQLTYFTGITSDASTLWTTSNESAGHQYAYADAFDIFVSGAVTTRLKTTIRLHSGQNEAAGYSEDSHKCRCVR